MSKLPTRDDPNLLDTLAAAYAAAGRFSEAAHTAREAAELAAARGQESLVEMIRTRERLYLAERTYVERGMRNSSSASP